MEYETQQNKFVNFIKSNQLLVLFIAFLVVIYLVKRKSSSDDDVTSEEMLYSEEMLPEEMMQETLQEEYVPKEIQAAEEVIKSRENIAIPGNGKVLYNYHLKNDRTVSGCGQDQPGVDRNIYSSWPYVEWEQINPTWSRFDGLNY